MYVNQAALLKSVAGISSFESRRDTNPSSKSYVSPQEYPFDSYPGLCIWLRLYHQYTDSKTHFTDIQQQSFFQPRICLYKI